MDSETRQLLLEAVNLSRENNKMLRSMRNGQRWSKVFSFVKYLIILSLALGAYYYLQPYIKNLTDALNQVVGGIQGLKDFKPF